MDGKLLSQQSPFIPFEYSVCLYLRLGQLAIITSSRGGGVCMRGSVLAEGHEAAADAGAAARHGAARVDQLPVQRHHTVPPRP